MKNYILAVVFAAVCLLLFACDEPQPSTPAQTTTLLPSSAATAPSSTAPVETTAAPTTVPVTTAPPVLTGWQSVDGRTYYYLADGRAATGWITVEGQRYYMGEDGVMVTGWLVWQNGIYFLNSDGAMVTGWMELDGKHYCFAAGGTAQTGWYSDDNGDCRYFAADGAMVTGWLYLDGTAYYFDDSGVRCVGWIEVGGNRYYLDSDGTMVTGWIEQEGRRYYLQENGAMARGCVQIDGVNNFFASTGEYVLLVNPWNYVPEGYDPGLVELTRYANYDNMYISGSCYDALMQMLKDCESQCGRAVVVSAYRTHEFQTKNYQRKVNYYLNLGYSQADAEVLAAKVVAVPGTSEHQLGLAVDIVDVKFPYLEKEQEDMPAQKWLMAHCWEYGFILRYPEDKTQQTGIIYEPWHYRYVGPELAKELHELDLTLEEYMDALTQTP